MTDPWNQQGGQGQPPQPGYGGPAPGYGQPPYPQQPGQPSPGPGQYSPPPTYGQSPSYGPPAGSRPAPYPQPGYGQPPSGAPGYGSAGYGQPGYPGGYGEPPSRANRSVVIAAAAAVLLVLGLILFFVLKGGGGGGSTGSPADAVTRYINALKARNLSAAKGAVCASRRGEVTSDDLPSSDEDVSKVTLKINSTRNTNSTHATVNATLTTPADGPVSFDIDTLKESGKWRVCSEPRPTH
jgi:hypothetical protein